MSLSTGRLAPVDAAAADVGAARAPVAEPSPDRPDRAQRVARAATALAQDAVDALIIERLHGRGLRPTLLKGPVTARRLYPGEYRPRADCDLLVHPARFPAARAVLVEAGLRPCDPSAHAQTFLHPSGHAVDLHWTLPVATAPAERIWSALARHTVEFRLGGTAVAALDLPAHACHLALHAISTPARSQAARRDLERAVARIPLATWREALRVADELGARPAIVAALRTGSPACWRLADLLGLPARVPFAQRLWLADASLLLDARQILRAAPPARRREMLRRWLLPTAAELASWGERPEVRAGTPAVLPPRGRMLWYRARQVVQFAAAVVRASARAPADVLTPAYVPVPADVPVTAGARPVGAAAHSPRRSGAAGIAADMRR